MPEKIKSQTNSYIESLINNIDSRSSNMTIEQNVSLNDKNWFQTGGAAKFYAEPKSENDFAKCISFANKNNLEIFVLGLGANVLISDDGFDGLVIRPALKEIVIENLNGLTKDFISCQARDKNSQNKPVQETAIVTAGAGATLDQLINFCFDNNIIGLEEFSGIPGTVGGSVYINVHYFKYFLSDFLESAKVINAKTGNVKTVDKSWFNFGYDSSQLLNKNEFLVNATFCFKKASDLETAYARGRHTEIVRHRVSRYPATHTCGSFFRNFHDNEVTQTIAGTNNKLIFIAYYFDKLGIKGELKVGDAVVSHKHANMLVNNGNATSTDIINLARKMQELVKENFGIIPQAECQLVGFKQYPLL